MGNQPTRPKNRGGKKSQNNMPKKDEKSPYNSSPALRALTASVQHEIGAQSQSYGIRWVINRPVQHPSGREQRWRIYWLPPNTPPELTNPTTPVVDSSGTTKNRPTSDLMHTTAPLPMNDPTDMGEAFLSLLYAFDELQRCHYVRQLQFSDMRQSGETGDATFQAKLETLTLENQSLQEQLKSSVKNADKWKRAYNKARQPSASQQSSEMKQETIGGPSDDETDNAVIVASYQSEIERLQYEKEKLQVQMESCMIAVDQWKVKYETQTTQIQSLNQSLDNSSAHLIANYKKTRAINVGLTKENTQLKAELKRSRSNMSEIEQKSQSNKSESQSKYATIAEQILTSIPLKTNAKNSQKKSKNPNSALNKVGGDGGANLLSDAPILGAIIRDFDMIRTQRRTQFHESLLDAIENDCDKLGFDSDYVFTDDCYRDMCTLSLSILMECYRLFRDGCVPFLNKSDGSAIQNNPYFGILLNFVQFYRSNRDKQRSKLCQKIVNTIVATTVKTFEKSHPYISSKGIERAMRAYVSECCQISFHLLLSDCILFGIADDSSLKLNMRLHRKDENCDGLSTQILFCSWPGVKLKRDHNTFEMKAKCFVFVN